MSAIRKGLQSERGFTLVEVTIILLVLVILSTIMLPQLGNFNRLARFVVVKEDVGAICASLKKMLDEVMLGGFYKEPGGTTLPPALPVGLLVGPGPIPTANVVDGDYNCSANAWLVDAAANATFNCATDSAANGSTITFLSDRLKYHLQVNDPLNAGGMDAHDRYKNVIDDPTIPWPFGWVGPYFNEINADPWGGRYSVNVFGLIAGNHAQHGLDDVFMTPVICISWGPNGVAETEPNMPGSWINVNAPDYLIGGDDIAAVLSAGGPF